MIDHVSARVRDVAASAAVHAFHDAAVAAGVEVLHAPQEWPEYHPDYFGAFVRDAEGNNVEAVCQACWHYYADGGGRRVVTTRRR